MFIIGDKMSLTNVDKKFLIQLIKKQLDKFAKEGNTIIIHDDPSFLANEQKYDDFLNDIIKKLSE